MSFVFNPFTGKLDVVNPAPDLSGYVPTSRTVNGYALTSNITLEAFDVGAASAADLSTVSGVADTAYTLAGTAAAASVPVGGTIAWLKSLTGTPALGADWVECNGQTLSDAGSVYNGVVIPNLNASGGGTKRFLRGSTTSGTTGGADTVALTVANMPAHNHQLSPGGYCCGGNLVSCVGGSVCCPCYISNFVTASCGSGTAHANLPSYYEVVWIMRVK